MIERPREPEPPAAPSLAPCPKGWRQVGGTNAIEVTCAPWPEAGPEDCTGDQAHFPGGAACETVGDICPDGEWAENLPAEPPVVYVRAGEPDRGTGTRDRPFGSIQDAIAVAEDGAIVALSKGTFDESVRLRKPVTLWRACVAETEIVPSVPSDVTPTVELTLRGGATLKNVRVSGDRIGVWVHANAGEVVLDSVVVDSAEGIAVLVESEGVLRATNLVVRDTRDRDGDFGYALSLTSGARAMLVRAVFERNRTVGIWVDGGTELIAADLAVRDTRSRALDDAGGYGVQIAPGGSVELDRAALSGNLAAGILMRGTAAQVVAADLWIADTRSSANGGEMGAGLDLGEGARADLARATIERNRAFGVVALGPDTQITVTDAVIRRTEYVTMDQEGWGLAVGDGARAVLERARFSGNQTAGIGVTNGDAEVIGTDLVIADTRSREGHFGFGLVVRDARVELLRVRLDRNHSAGIDLQGGGELTAVDLVVADTVGNEEEGRFGNGLQAVEGSSVLLERAAFERNRQVGLFVAGSGTAMTATDLLVEWTLTQDCVQGCPDEAGGTGILVYDGAAVTVSRFRTSDNALCGVQLADRGELDLQHGEVARNLIGANVQTAGFDIRRLQDDVAWIDNERTLDASLLPLPDSEGLPVPVR